MSASPLPSDAAAARTSGADIIDSIDVPILAVGRDCAISRFNPAAATFLSLTPADLGRPVREIPLLRNVKLLDELCEEAIGSGASSQREVRDATTGSWFVLRIAPYLGSDQRATGAVLTLQNVTAFRASLEQAIYEREYTKVIINTVIDPLVVLDDECRVQAANQAFYTKFHVSREQAQGARLYEIGSRDWEVPRLQKFLKETHANNQSDAQFEHEFPAIGLRTLLLNARRLSSQGGNVGQMILLVIQDITERKQREDARRRAEEELRDFVENASVGMHWVGADGTIIWANQAELDLLGYTREEYIGQSIGKFHADQPVISYMLDTLAWGGEVQDFEARLRCKDGSIRNVIINSSARFEDGKFVHMRCFTRDMTRRKQVEEKLREREELLRQAQQVASIGTFEWNIKTGVNRWTPELETMYGLPQGGFLGTQTAWEQLVHPEDRDEAVRGIARALKEGSFEGEWRVIWPDGSVHWLLGRALIFKDEAGEPERLIGVNIDVTARKRADSALEQSERRFREIIDLLPAAIYTTDAEGRLTHFNRAAVELSGRTPQLGTDRWCVTWKLFRPDGTRLPHDECPMAVALKKGLVMDGVEAIAERPDGSRVWFTPYPRPLRNAEGAVVGGINMLMDITDRKKSEQTTGLLAAIVDSSDDAIVSKSLDGVITSWNKSAERLFGYTAEEAVGQHITLIVPPDRRHEETTILDQLKRAQRIDHFETVRMRKDGKTLDISLTISPVKDATGRVIGASKVARDITERKRVEQALAERAQLLDLSNDAIIVRDGEDRVTYWNKSASELYGYSREEALGRVTHELLQTEHPEALGRIFEELHRDGRWTGELIHRHKDGSPIVVVSRWALDRDDHGNRKHVLETNNDITRQKQREQALRESQEQLRALADGLENLVSVRTRELQQRNVEILRQSEQLQELSQRLLQIQDDERRHIARELHDSAGQVVVALGMNLASIARHAKKNSPLDQPVKECQELVQQLNREIRTMSYLLHPPLLDENGLPEALHWYIQGVKERSGLDISLNIPEDFERLSPEMELVIFRVVQESLTNIHRHSGSKIAEIRIDRKAESVSLEVRDEGKGISPERLNEIQSQGSGVGIRGIRERVRQFGGDMNIESNGSGTTVSATFPITKRASSELSTTDQQVQAAR
jgi:PAS domain S-box-containing protein